MSWPRTKQHTTPGDNAKSLRLSSDRIYYLAPRSRAKAGAPGGEHCPWPPPGNNRGRVG